MSGNAVLGEHMKQEEASEFFGGDLALGRDKDTLLREAVNDEGVRQVLCELPAGLDIE